MAVKIIGSSVIAVVVLLSVVGGGEVVLFRLVIKKALLGIVGGITDTSFQIDGFYYHSRGIDSFRKICWYTSAFGD